MSKHAIEYRMSGLDKIYLDKICLTTKCAVRIKILSVEFPNFDFYKKEHVLLIGVVFFNKKGMKNDNVCINDRCAIYRNDAYLAMLSFKNGKLITNGSEIRINVNNRQRNPFVEFAHFKNGRLCTRNRERFDLRK